MPNNYELTNEGKAWARGAYGESGGRYLIEHLPKAKSHQEVSQIIARSASLDTRIREMKERTTTPHLDLLKKREN